MELKRKNVLLLTAGICLGVIIGAIFYYQPFWGLMDDTTIFSMLEKIKLDGFWLTWKQFVHYDFFVSGRLRPFFPVMMVALYGIFPLASVPTYLLNAGFVFFIFYFLAILLRDYFFDRQKNHDTFTYLMPLFLVLSFAFPWTHYFFMIPALQEKLVLLALLLFLFFFQNLVKTKSLFIYIPSTFLLLAIGIATKEQFVIFFPLFLFLQLSQDANNGSYHRAIFLFILELFAVFIIWKIGAQGGYKSKYGFSNALLTLRQSKSVILFLAFIVLHSVMVISYLRPKKINEFLQNIYWFSPGVCLLAFLVIMIPWGLGGYLNAVTAPLVVLGILQLLIIIKSRQPAWIFSGYIYVFSILAIALTLYNSILSFASYGDIRKIIYSPELKELANAKATIYMPCEEGAGAIALYAEQFAGVSVFVKPVLSIEDFQAIKQKTSYWIISPLRCYPDFFPFLELIDIGKAKVLWQPSIRKSFYLLKLTL